MHACPCGFYGDSTRECRCTGAIIQRYLGKISGPLLDRIDLHIEVPAVAYKDCGRMEMALPRMKSADECLPHAQSSSLVVSTTRIFHTVGCGETVSAKHLAEAVQYRSLDRSYWQ